MLRPYQLECISSSLKAFDKFNRICVSLPVGSGKTVIFSHLISKLPNPLVNNKARKVLVLAHRKELLTQAYNQIQKYNPDLSLAIDQGNLKLDYESLKKADVVCSSTATLGRLSSRIEKYDPNDFKAIIIDEAHHASASTYQNILNYMKAYESDSHIKVWGCSATLRRHDGISLSPTFEDISFHKPIIEMIREKWLCDIQLSTVRTNVNLDGISRSSGDYNLSELSRKINTVKRNDKIVQSYVEQAKNFNRKSTLIFAVDISHINSLVERFKLAGIDARGIDSKTYHADREDILQRFRIGSLPVLINCGILTEGVDIPSIDMIILARPTKSGVLLQQMLGRGMRLHADKKFCIVLDFVDSPLRGKMMQATVPTLFGLNPNSVLKDQSLFKTAKRIEEEKGIEDLAVGKGLENDNLDLEVKLGPFVDPFATANQIQDSLFIRQLSKLAWVRAGERKFVLQIPPNYLITLERKEDGLYHGTVKKKFRQKSIVIKNNDKNLENFDQPSDKSLNFVHDDISSALNAFDLFVKTQFGYMTWRRLKWNAPWRNEKLTSGQLNYLEKMGISNPDLRTRGYASDLICKRIHGAKGAAEESKRAVVRASKEKLKKDGIFI